MREHIRLFRESKNSGEKIARAFQYRSFMFLRYATKHFRNHGQEQLWETYQALFSCSEEHAVKKAVFDFESKLLQHKMA